MSEITSNSTNNHVAFKYIFSGFICAEFGSLLINEERNIVSFGKNENGYLGHEEINKIIYPPKQIPNLLNIKMIACGYNHTACINFEGNLFTFGNNNKGQLGLGKDGDTITFTHVPQHILDIPPIEYISCGDYRTICITDDRNALSFGDNTMISLDFASFDNSYSSPKLIDNLNNIEFIASGSFFCIAKTYSNEYYSWGFNSNGQLGQGHNGPCTKPFKCSNWPDDIIDIKCGYSHTLLLTSKGYVYSFGSNRSGNLGLNDKNNISINIPTLIKDIPLIKRIECGYFNSMCIDINDKLWVFGNNSTGQLGLGDTKERFKPTLNESLHDIINISSGGNHAFIKTINNEIYAFGDNTHSQFGIKTTKEKQLTPIQVFKDNEDIWVTTIRSKQKSARK